MRLSALPPDILSERAFSLSAAGVGSRRRGSGGRVRTCSEAADSVLAGTWTVLGTRRAPTAPSPDWFYDPLTGRRAPDDRLAFRIHHRDEAETGNIKQVWEMSRHHHVTVLAAAWWLTQDGALRRGGRGSAALLVECKPVPDRRALDERHRGRHPPDLLGVDPPVAR